MAQVIAASGGSCSGKTTLIRKIVERLKVHNIRALCPPEVATIMITGAVPDIAYLRQHDPDLYRHIQNTFIDTQIAMEERFQEMARRFEDAGERVVIIPDRGIPDNDPYMDGGGKDYVNALARHGLNPDTARLQYHATVYLVTAAHGAEAHYSNATNPIRIEKDLDVARHVCDLTLRAWTGHPHMLIVDNIHSTDFDHKIERAITAVERMLGIPVPIEIEKKFLVELPMSDFYSHIAPISRWSTIEQMYLKSPVGERVRIRKRIFESGHTLYYETKKRDIAPGKRYEVERQITENEYKGLMAYFDSNTRIIKKSRCCFPYKHQYFELDVFEEPCRMTLLEHELLDENDPTALPPFLGNAKDVTNDPSYSNFAIASR
jgi:CYTH domain-containing protein